MLCPQFWWDWTLIFPTSRWRAEYLVWVVQVSHYKVSLWPLVTGEMWRPVHCKIGLEWGIILWIVHERSLMKKSFGKLLLPSCSDEGNEWGMALTVTASHLLSSAFVCFWFQRKIFSPLLQEHIFSTFFWRCQEIMSDSFHPGRSENHRITKIGKDL